VVERIDGEILTFGLQSQECVVIACGGVILIIK
jgi:hypothetical protein